MEIDEFKLREAVFKIKGDVILPNDLESVIYHTISSMGSKAIRECSNKSLCFKYAYVLGYCLHLEQNTTRSEWL